MRKFQTDHYDHPLSQYSAGWERAAPVGSEIGIEIEVEGRNLPRQNLTGWVLHEDGSLRGESAEYVFRGPIPRAGVPNRLAILERGFVANESVINESYRTSVHVHMNVRDFLIKHIYNNIILYVICEDILAELAGKDRVGNLFCLRAKDAEYFLESLRSAIVTDNLRELAADNLRYSAVNPASMWRHGSLEFRSFRGTTDMRLIQQWVDVLCCIRDAAQRYNNPIEIVQDMSAKGAREFVRGIFGDEIVTLFAEGFEDKVYAGAQLVQHAAFAHDWTPRKVTPKKNASSSTMRYDNIDFTDLGVMPRPVRWVTPEQLRNNAAPLVQVVNELPAEATGLDGTWHDAFNEEEV